MCGFRQGHNSVVTTHKPKSWTISSFEPRCPFEKKLREEHEEIWLAATTNLFWWITQIHLWFWPNTHSNTFTHSNTTLNATHNSQLTTTQPSEHGSLHKIHWESPASKRNQLYMLWYLRIWKMLTPFKNYLTWFRGRWQSTHRPTWEPNGTACPRRCWRAWWRYYLHTSHPSPQPSNNKLSPFIFVLLALHNTPTDERQLRGGEPLHCRRMVRKLCEPLEVSKDQRNHLLV